MQFRDVTDMLPMPGLPEQYQARGCSYDCSKTGELGAMQQVGDRSLLRLTPLLSQYW